MSIDAIDLKLAYLNHSTKTKIKNLRIATFLAFILFVIFAIVDSFVYPQQSIVLISVRVINNIMLALIFLATYRKTFNHKSISYINIFTILLLSTSICTMIMVTEGGASTYYAGLNLVLVGTSVLLFLDLRETVIASIGTISLYISACLLHYQQQANVVDYEWSTFFNNLSFLSATAIICAFASYYLSKNRFETFRLNFELKEMDRVKTEFFANVSHEIRTPLTLVLSPLEELLRGTHQLSDYVAGHLKLARDNSMRLLKLVNNFLDIVRLEEGKSTLKKTPQDISVLLSGLADSMLHLAGTKDIVIEKSITDEVVMVSGDESALEKIFINIINNAIKFTRHGGRVGVSLKCVNHHTSTPTPQGGTKQSQRGTEQRAVVEITDSGIGISDADAAHIFERFNQVDSSSTRRFQGSGIGLSLVEDLVKAHDGKVEVESELGKGTLMRVVLPLLDQAEQVTIDTDTNTDTDTDIDLMQALHHRAERMAGLTVEEDINNEYDLRTDTHLPRLLIVDDEPDMRRYIKELLTAQYQIIQARDGQQALHLAKQYHPDLMVLDMMLPEIDGLEVCKRLKSDERTKDIKIILLTARADEAVKIEALENGANDFLTKPFSAIELRTRLNNLYTTLKLEQDLAQHNQELSQALVDLKAAEAQLLHSEKLSAIGSLASGLLHEVNNPLNYTITAAQILNREPSIVNQANNKEMVEDIIEGMDRIKTIVSDLHTFAHPEEAHKQNAFVLHDAISSALRFTAYECKNVDIQLNVADDLRVIGSNNHIVQVLINLITNAVKAIDADKQQAIINFSTQMNGKRLLLRVRDNGKGMNEAILSRIFEPFYTTQEVGEGLGLGLSICHTIIKSHGGELKVQSKLGEWTEFSFDLEIVS